MHGSLQIAEKKVEKTMKKEFIDIDSLLFAQILKLRAEQYQFGP